MSATEILQELPNLTEVERLLLLERLQALMAHDSPSASRHSPHRQPQAKDQDHLNEKETLYQTVDLLQHGVSETQAANLRHRLTTFAEDWDRPEAAIYDEDPPR